MALRQPSICELPAESGKRAREDTGQEQDRQIIDDGGGVHDQHGDRQLPQIVAQRGEYADHPHPLRRKQRPQQGADAEGQQTAGHAKEKGHHLTGGDTAQRHPYQQDTEGGASPQSVQGEHRDHIGKSQLDPRDGGEGGELCFHGKDTQGDGGEQGGQGELAGGHGTAPVTVSTSSDTLSWY